MGKSGVVFGQFTQDWLSIYNDFDPDNDKEINLDIEGNNFFRNNEYDSPFLQGYTLIGYSLRPTIEYYADPKFRIKGGIHLLKYDGVEAYTDVIPYVSANLLLTKNLQVIMGGLKGGVQHGLLEPIFNPERQYTRPVENGVQFLFNSKRLDADVWLDWMQFIQEGDTIPEKFAVGINAKYKLSKSDNPLRFSIPFQLLARHIGGEISDYTEKMQSYVNLVGGVKVESDVIGGFIHGVRGGAFWLGYKDLLDQGLLGINSGSAWYTDVNVKFKYGEFYSAYFKGNDFIGILGNGLFNSVSSGEKDFYQKNRSLVVNKLSFVKSFFTDLKFSLTLQSYYDVINNNLMYSYGFNIVLTDTRRLFK